MWTFSAVHTTSPHSQLIAQVVEPVGTSLRSANQVRAATLAATKQYAVLKLDVVIALASSLEE